MQIWMDVDTALSEVPVNVLPLIDDTDFKSVETAIVYNSAGLTLYWHFVTPAGAYTVTQVTPTTGGDYDWSGDGTDPSGMYTIEIPASGGASINNDTEGFGWFTGVATGVLPWRGPIIGFRAAGLNDLLVESAYSATRGLAGTALPAAAADAAGGLPISDAGGLDMDGMNTNVSDILTDTAEIGAAGAGLTAITNKFLSEVVDYDTVTIVKGTLNAGSDAATAIKTLNDTDYYAVDCHAVNGLEVEIDYEVAAFPYNKLPVAVKIVGEFYGTGAGSETLTVHAYDWVASAYEQIGSFSGQAVDEDRYWVFPIKPRHFRKSAATKCLLINLRSTSTDTGHTLWIDYLGVLAATFDAGQANIYTDEIWKDIDAGLSTLSAVTATQVTDKTGYSILYTNLTGVTATQVTDSTFLGAQGLTAVYAKASGSWTEASGAYKELTTGTYKLSTLATSAAVQTVSATATNILDHLAGTYTVDPTTSGASAYRMDGATLLKAWTLSAATYASAVPAFIKRTV